MTDKYLHDGAFQNYCLSYTYAFLYNRVSTNCDVGSELKNR